MWPGPPFRLFFVLAVLDSIVGVGVWLPVLTGGSSFEIVAGPVAAWHARELVFTAFPAVLSGFLLTALPRWTGRAFMHPRLHVSLLAFWLCAPASLFLLPEARPAIVTGYLAVLTCIVGYLIVTAGSWRNLKILLLVAMLAGSAFADLPAISNTSDISIRMAIAAILGLVIVLGGRIIPSLTAVHLELLSRAGLPSSSRPIELAAAATATIALGAWIWSPDSLWTAGLSAPAAAGQAMRCLRWQPWRSTARPSLFALHGAYACIPIGFTLLSARAFDPVSLSETAALHVWTIGAIGLMSIAVMASMIRRHLGRPLTASLALNSAFILLMVALAARTAAEFLTFMREPLLVAGATSWVGSHLLFLAGFTQELLLGRPPSHR